MKNVTIAIDEETHRKARIRAAEQGTSLSALVKDYLNSLADGGKMEQGERDVQMPFHHDALAPLTPAQPSMGPQGQRYFVDGKWTFTKDGKPRKPGAMRGKIWIADDFDETPEWLIDAFYGIGNNEPWPKPE